MWKGPLISPPARPAVRWLAAACAVLVLVMALLFAHKTTPDWLDRSVDSQLISSLGGHWRFLLRITWLGTLIPAAVGSATLAIASRRLNGAALSIAAVPVSTVVCDFVFKPLVHRTYFGHLAYPSGHTCAVTALVTTLIVLVSRPEVARRWRVLAIVVSALAVTGVAVAVTALHWHYFTDTIAGAAIGIGTVCGLALLIDRIPRLA